MPKMSALPYPLLADWASTFIEQAERPLVRHCQDNLKAALSLSQSLPDSYHWQTLSTEEFHKRLKNGHNIHCWNYEFWGDWSKNSEAYSIMLCWRAIEIIKPAVRAINQQDLIAAAILARSLLELVSNYLMNANFIHSSCDGVASNKDVKVVSQECEDFIVKTIWGRRFLDPDEAHKQINALTQLQKLGKHPDANELVPTYEFLCEISHPNVVGYARFWSESTTQIKGGSAVREISRSANGTLQHELLENTIWALSFGARSISNGYQLIHRSLSVLMPWIKREAKLCRG
jgi:hypothetical protein